MKQPAKKKLTIYETADEFVEEYNAGYWHIKPEATKIPCGDGYGRMSLMNLLTQAITNYISAKTSVQNSLNNPEALKKACDDEIEWAQKLVLWKTHAYNVGVLVESEGVLTKLKKAETEIEQLKARLASTLELNKKLAKDKAEALKLLESKGYKTIGDVEPKE